MKLNNKDIEALKSVLAACKVVGIEGVVLGTYKSELKVMGATPSITAAILSRIELPISEKQLIGIGRVAELDKRLSIFSESAELDIKFSDKEDSEGNTYATMISISSGRSKMQFRCTSPSLMKYPKELDDPTAVTVILTKEEQAHLTKALKTLSAETVSISVSRKGEVSIEAADSANDKFEMTLAETVEEESLFQTYRVPMFVDILNNITSENSKYSFSIGGSIGSLTAQVKGHTVSMFPNVPGEEDED